jgi:3-phenylpropionate/trans-cinnamate dioxygenase ferredoxin reductase subunit
MNVNVWDVTDPLQSLIRSRRPVNAGQLRDPDLALDVLANDEHGLEPVA